MPRPRLYRNGNLDSNHEIIRWEDVAIGQRLDVAWTRIGRLTHDPWIKVSETSFVLSCVIEDRLGGTLPIGELCEEDGAKFSQGCLVKKREGSYYDIEVDDDTGGIFVSKSGEPNLLTETKPKGLYKECDHCGEDFFVIGTDALRNKKDPITEVVCGHCHMPNQLYLKIK